MSWKETYTSWINHPDLDPELRQNLDAIKGDEKQLEDSFYKTLEFGTGECVEKLERVQTV